MISKAEAFDEMLLWSIFGTINAELQEQEKFEQTLEVKPYRDPRRKKSRKWVSRKERRRYRWLSSKEMQILC